MKILNSYPVLFVAFESAVEVFEGDIIVLVQPLHDKRLEPSARFIRYCIPYVTPPRTKEKLTLGIPARLLCTEVNP